MALLPDVRERLPGQRHQRRGGLLLRRLHEGVRLAQLYHGEGRLQGGVLHSGHEELDRAVRRQLFSEKCHDRDAHRAG